MNGQQALMALNLINGSASTKDNSPSAAVDFLVMKGAPSLTLTSAAQCEGWSDDEGEAPDLSSNDQRLLHTAGSATAVQAAQQWWQRMEAAQDRGRTSTSTQQQQYNRTDLVLEAQPVLLTHTCLELPPVEAAPGPPAARCHAAAV